MKAKNIVIVDDDFDTNNTKIIDTSLWKTADLIFKKDNDKYRVVFDRNKKLQRFGVFQQSDIVEYIFE